MKRFFLRSSIWILLVFLLMATSCAMKPASDLFYVLFEQAPSLYETAVWDGGEEIGAIVSREPVAGAGEKISVSIKKEFMDRIRTNVVFYTAVGRLQLATVDAYGEPLAVDSAILGFHSKMAYRMFKLKTAFTRSAPVAAKHARMLLGKSM